MGVILCSYGDGAHDHEGYAAQVLDDGSLTSTYSDDTRPRMVGAVVAACGCGWTGSTRYPERERYDDAAEDLALAEWEHDHARPTLQGLRAEHWTRLGALLRQLAHSYKTAGGALISGLTPTEQRELLERTLAGLDRATTLARQLHEPLETTPGGAR
jgi:hypothetical protein